MRSQLTTYRRQRQRCANGTHSLYRKNSLSFPSRQQQGYALLTLVILLMIVGVMAAGAMNISNKSERLAGNAIQRNRAFQATDAAAYYAEAEIARLMQKRVYADDSATRGLFTFNKRPEEWWKTGNSGGVHTVPANSVLGVVKPPAYSIEQVGDYISDGGTGIVNLDVGGAAYGRITSGGREIILYNVQSHGNGSFDEVKTVVETAVAFSY